MSLLDDARRALPVGHMHGRKHGGGRQRADGAEAAPDGIYPAGRRCADHDDLGCITILSIYNPGPWCFVHQQRHEAELFELDVELDDDELDEQLRRLVA